MFGFPDGRIGILKGKIAELKIPYLAKQHERLECKSVYLYDEVENGINAKGLLPVIIWLEGRPLFFTPPRYVSMPH